MEKRGPHFHFYFAQYKQCLTLVKKVSRVPVYTADKIADDKLIISLCYHVMTAYYLRTLILNYFS
jgi:hypothetical protein